MVRTTFSGREVVKVLHSFGYVPVSRRGSHVRLRYEHPETGEVRNVDVPQHREIRIGTLRSIADQCGADDFYEWCRCLPLLRWHGGGDYCKTEQPKIPIDAIF